MVAAHDLERLAHSLSANNSNFATKRKRIFQLFGLLILSALFLHPLAAMSDDAIADRAYLEDASNELQLKDAQADTYADQFKPYTGPLKDSLKLLFLGIM